MIEYINYIRQNVQIACLRHDCWDMRAISLQAFLACITSFTLSVLFDLFLDIMATGTPIIAMYTWNVYLMEFHIMLCFNYTYYRIDENDMQISHNLQPKFEIVLTAAFV